jgi:hypothetical protein
MRRPTCRRLAPCRIRTERAQTPESGAKVYGAKVYGAMVHVMSALSACGSYLSIACSEHARQLRLPAPPLIPTPIANSQG